MPEETNTTAPVENATAPAKEEAKKTKVVIPPTHAFDTVRNPTGVEGAEVTYPIMQYVKTRGDNEGAPYLRPGEVNKDTYETFRAWIGDEMLFAMLNAKMALMGSNITDDATPEEGPQKGILDLALAQQYFADFSTRGETKADLEEKKDDAVKQMMAASMDTSLSMVDKIAAIAKLGEQINSYQTAIDKKARERKPKAPANASATAPATATV